jgi:hypothetical protein
MFVVTMKKVAGQPNARSGLIAESGLPVLNFAISYSAHPSVEQFGFKIFCRQIGGGVALPHTPLIDVLIPDIVSGSSIVQISDFLHKFINMEFRTCYVYESHSNPTCVNIRKWASLFTNFSRLISISVQQLDDVLNARNMDLVIQASQPACYLEVLTAANSFAPDEGFEEW